MRFDLNVSFLPDKGLLGNSAKSKIKYPKSRIKNPLPCTCGERQKKHDLHQHMLLTQLPVNTRWKSQLKLSLFIAMWLVVFLVLIAPFDAGELPFRIRLILLPPYGLLFIIAYLPAVALQNYLYRQLQYWNPLLESLIVLLTYGLCLPLCYAYYRTDLVRGEFSFMVYAATVFLPTLVIMSGLLLFGRWFISRRPEIKTMIETVVAKPEMIALSGDNKNDVLRLRPDQLVCINGAQNYAEVHYLQDGQLNKQLLRTTLTKLSQQAPDLLRVHRSYLINPAHFVRWEGTSVAIFHSLEVPVTKTHREELERVLKKD